ncbi:MAG: hypothetical protein Kow0037_25950 [Calditrichia bacterium]
MAKKQDFASKVQKSLKAGQACKVCGNVYTFLKRVDSVYAEETGSWKYRTVNMKVCSCNEKEAYD